MKLLVIDVVFFLEMFWGEQVFIFPQLGGVSPPCRITETSLENDAAFETHLHLEVQHMV